MASIEIKSIEMKSEMKSEMASEMKSEMELIEMESIEIELGKDLYEE